MTNEDAKLALTGFTVVLARRNATIPGIADPLADRHQNDGAEHTGRIGNLHKSRDGWRQPHEKHRDKRHDGGRNLQFKHAHIAADERPAWPVTHTPDQRQVLRIALSPGSSFWP